MPLLSDADGHASILYYGSYLKSEIRLYRNGELVSTSDFFGCRGDVPAEAAAAFGGPLHAHPGRKQRRTRREGVHDPGQGAAPTRRPGSRGKDPDGRRVQRRRPHLATRQPEVARRHHLHSHRHPPSTSEFVSLRAKSTDTAGNSVDHTIIRAYRIKRP